MGEPARIAQDDRSPVPGHRGARHPGSRGRRRDAGARHLRQLLGQDRSRRGRRRRPTLPRRVVPPRLRKTLPVESSRHAFAYVFEGSGSFRDASAPRAVRTEWVGDASGTPEFTGNRSLVLFDTGDEITVQAGDAGIRFLLVSGRPIAEPVAWRGPIVMNTEAELRRAYAELQDGSFIKHR